MKKYIYILSLFGLHSCYPPRIIYDLDVTTTASDSIAVSLIKGSTTSINTVNILSPLFLDIENKSNSKLKLKNSTLELLVDSTVLKFHLNAENKNTFPHQLETSTNDSILLWFELDDTKHYLYNNIMGHTLKLSFDISDSKNYNNKVVYYLKPYKTRTQKFEREGKK